MANPTVQPRRDQLVVTIGGLKGGLGKSTLALFLAMVYALRGERVLLVDADPKSQTGWDWWTTADDAGTPLPFDLEVWPHPRVGSMITRRATDYDVVVVDTGGDSDEIMASAVVVSTWVLLATTPNKADLRRVPATVEAAQRAASDDTVFAVVLVRTDARRAGYNAETRSVVLGGFPVLSATVSEVKTRYADAWGTVPTRESLAQVEAIVAEMEEV